jgi:FG-GAP repeat
MRIPVVARVPTLVGLATSACLISSPSIASAASCGSADGDPPDNVIVGVPSKNTVDVTEEFLHTRHRVTGPTSFGSAIAAGDLNADQCLDIAVGAPSANGVGTVQFILGTAASGVGTGSRITLPYPGGHSGDRFGAAVAVETVFTQNPATNVERIWVGIPGADVDGQTDAGAIGFYRVTRARLTNDLKVAGPTIITQNSPGIPGAAEAGDRFGEVITTVPGAGVVGIPH